MALSLGGLKERWDAYWQSMRADAVQAESRRAAYVAIMEAEHQ